VEDLAYLAFWVYNTTTLLHLLRSDPDVGPACEELNLLGMIEELINAIHGRCDAVWLENGRADR
jgi:hypothetical protein